MLKGIITVFCLMAGSIASAQPAPGSPGSDPVKTEVMLKMAQLRASLLDRDSVALEKLLAEDVTYGHSNGLLQSKKEIIHSVMSGEQDYKKIDVRKIDIRIFGNTAVVNLESDVSLIMAGKPLDIDMDILLVWIRENGSWKLVARQSVKNS